MLAGALRRPLVFVGVGSFLVIGLWYIVPLLALMSGLTSGGNQTPRKWIMVIEDSLSWQEAYIDLFGSGFDVTVDPLCSTALTRISQRGKMPFGAIVDGVLEQGVRTEVGLDCVREVHTISPSTIIAFVPGESDSGLEVLARLYGATIVVGKNDVGDGSILEKLFLVDP